MNRGLVTLVVPAKDEAAAIAATLRSLPLATLHASGFRTEVLVLDGNSRDETASIALACGAAVRLDRGRGKGSALRDARREVRGDFVVMLDADGTYAPDAIPRVLAPLSSGDADVVMGDRAILDGAMSAVHRAGNAMLSLAATVLYGTPVRDLCTGLWGFRTDALRRLPLKSRGFELEAELFALSARLGLRIRHTPVDYLPRMGTSKLHTRDAVRIGLSLVRNRFVAVGAGAPGGPSSPPALDAGPDVTPRSLRSPQGTPNMFQPGNH